jgi:branched-chain amino acid transport system permease protein
MLGSIYAVVGVAFTLGIGILKFLNFSIPGLFMIAAMMTWTLVRIGTPWPLAALGALATGAALAALIERFTWRWMRHTEPFVPLVSSMAFLMLFENLAVVYWGSDLRSLPRLFDNADWRIGALVVSLPQLAGLAISVGLVSFLAFLLNKTWLGRALRTIAEDSETARLLGVNLDRIVPAVFAISGVFAALGGILFAINYRQVYPFMSEALGLKGIAAMIVGGMGNTWGAVAGGLIIGLAEVLSINFFGADFVDVSVYGLLLAILILRPTGLLGAPDAGARA